MIMATNISNIELGEPGFLGALQNTTTILLNDLSPEDREEYAQSAVEWSIECYISVGTFTPCGFFDCELSNKLRSCLLCLYQRRLALIVEF
jgi:hypothetical protein